MKIGIFLLILAVLLVFISGCESGYSEEEINKQFQEELEKQAKLQEALINERDLAIELKDLSKCDAIKEQDFKHSCYTAIAIELKDPSVCEGIKVNPEDYMTFKNRMSEEELRGWCYAFIATELNDPSICYKTSHEGWKASCLGGKFGLIKDPAECDGLNEGIDRNTCYFNVARAIGDTSVCEKISDVDLKGACQDSDILLY